MKILIINGPNLNLLGIRETAIYSSQSWEDFIKPLRLKYAQKSIELYDWQSNVEGDIISKLHEADYWVDGIILNAGGYTHTSVAIGDAVKAISKPVVEVHISNIAARESFRHTSYISPHCVGVIFGFGLMSYVLAIEYFILKSKE
ncbi:3-dehydroquinate dehydratase [Thermaurantimonas aggregans]|uniref:3-dehydroquinate dehydratase n=1 Tax=Thermaurantimonas aggregans TaxID=2173829 RepID=A0A401XL38_9FLAO|nr:type II 3-dehydroquinate dehydratase [Thermaurantimonas aggregans]MCX8149719.1 type II 3-dehydroquinate dehydratase [Thermaurantimonas aggregans]GCD77713.1 3-dehydroquinate dehydratase [Thermaurantimonas aggregans]